MRISISNIAWDVSEDNDVAQFLARSGIDAIDIAPGKYFPNFAATTKAGIHKVRDYWKSRDIDIVGMQSLLFGTEGLNLFGDANSRGAMLKHLREVVRIGAALGATRLVFGSPRNRDRGTLNGEAARTVALDFFRLLGDIAQREGVVVCIEPNPHQYGCNFLTTTREAAELVTMLGHPAIRLQLDSGAITMNAEHALDEIAANYQLAGHVHVSEPNLLPIGDSSTDHTAFSAGLFRYLPQKIVTIEMLATKDEPHLSSISRACGKVLSVYRDTSEIKTI
jgi:D-psicose/D-tagatose/L-ribulose 3-epimerase